MSGKVSEDYIDKFFQYNIDLLCIADLNGNIIQLNPMWDRFLGYGAGELDGSAFMSLIHPGNVQQTQDCLNDLLEDKETAVFTNRIRHKDGTYRWIEWRAFIADDNLCLTGHDIAMMKLTKGGLNNDSPERHDVTGETDTQEEASKKNDNGEALYKSTLESINTAILIVGADGDILHYNQSFVDLFSVPEELLYAKDDKRLIDYAKRQLSDPDEFVKKIALIYSQNNYSQDIINFKNGHLINRQFFPLKKEKPARGGVWTFEDITLEKLNEEALLKNQKTLKDSQRVAGIGSWENNIREREFIWQEEVYHILGYEVQEIELSYENFKKMIHPDDLADVIKVHREIIDSKVFIEHEYRVIRKDGKQRIVHVYGDVVLDENNDLIRTYGIVQDVTEQRENEENLLLFKTSIDESSDAVFWLNRNAGFEYVNDKACDNLGYTREEMLQMTIEDIDPGTSKEEWDRLWEQFKSGEDDKRGYIVEKYHRRKDGSVMPVEALNKYFCFDNTEYIIAYIRDISERRSMMAKLQESERLMKDLLSNLPGVAYRCLNNKDWEMVFLSEGCLELTGYMPEQLLHGSGAGYSVLVHKEDREYVWKKIQEAIVDNKRFEIEYRIITKNNQIKWVWERGKKILCDETEYLEGFISDINERKNAENELTRSQRLLTESQKAGKIGSWEYYIETEEFVWNEQVFEIYGVDKSAKLDFRTFVDLIHPDDREYFMSKYYDNLEKRFFSEFEFRIIRPDNVLRYVKTSGNIEYTENDKPYRTYGLVQDITEQRKTEENLRLFKISIDNSSDLVLWHNADAGFEYVNDKACRSLGYTREELMKMNLFDIDPFYTKEQWNETRKKILENKNRETVNIHIKSVHRRKDGSTYPVEIMGTNFWIGDKEYNITHVRDITERMQYEETLIKNQKLLIESQRIARIGSWEMDIPSRNISLNDGAINILGLDKKDSKITLEVFWSMILPEDLNMARKHFEETLNTKEFKEFECRFRQADDTIQTIRIIGELILDEKETPLRMMGIVQDITERKRAEESLRLTQFSIDSSSDSFIWIDENAKVFYANEAACKSLGYTHAEILNLKAFDFDPDFKKEAWAEHKTQLQAQKRMAFESRHQRKDGTVFPVEVTTNYINYNGKFFACTFDRDITERKQYEEDLLKNQKLLNESQRIAQMGSWELNLEDNSVYWSDSTFLLYGLDKNKDKISYELYLQLVHPDDRDKVILQTSNTVNTGKTENDEFRIIRPDGQIRDMITTAEVIKSDDKPLRIIGIVKDITEVKIADRALKASEQKMQSLFRVVPAGMGIAYNRIITDVNPELCRMTGYTKEELVGKNTRILYPSEEEYLNVGEVLYSELHLKSTQKIETIWKRKDGSLLNLYIALTQIDPEVPEKGVSFTALDITDRKNYEMALEKQVLALTRPLDDIRSIEFTDIFSIDHLQELQDAFSNATGVASLITFPDGRPITKPSNFCRLCDMVRSTEKGRLNCMKSDAKIGEFNLSGPIVHPCFSAGLWDAGASITLGGIHVANWLVGQVRDSGVKERDVLAYADEIGIPREEYSKALNEVKTMSEEQFKAITDALYLLANEISVKSYQNIQQARFIAEEKKVKEELLKNQKLLLESQRIARIGSWELDLSSNELFWNREAYQVYGYDYLSVKPTMDVFFQLIHPEDRSFMEEHLKTAINKKKQEDVYCRIITPDGTLKYLILAGELLLDDKKKPSRLFGIVQDITEQKNYEAQIIREKERAEESEQKLQRIFDFAPISIGLLNNRVVIDVNSQLCNLTWYDKNELIGKESVIVFPSREEYDRIGKIMYTELEQNGFSEHESCWKRKDGKIINVYLALTYLDPEAPSKGVLFSALDITGLKETEEHLRREKERAEESEFFLQESQRSGNIGSFKLNIKSQSWMSTETLNRIFGITDTYQRDYESWIDIIHPDDQEAIKNYMENEVLVYKHMFDYEYRIIRKNDNKTRWVHSIGKLYLDTDGNPDEMLGTIQDITDRKLIEEERRMMNIELENRVIERTSELHKVNKDLESFAYSVSHDLRAPIRHIDGFAHLLQNAVMPTDAKAQNYIDKIFFSAKNMSVMIDALLNFSRLGRTEIRFRDVDLNEIVNDIINQFKPDYLDRNIQWEIRPVPPVKGDPALLRIAMENLISNAIKYTSKNEETTIEIGESDNDSPEKICIYVKDNGVGFDMAYKSKLFGVFQRLHHKDEFEGTGIGLANVKQIISRHKGSIDAISEIDKGTTFFITLLKA